MDTDNNLESKLFYLVGASGSGKDSIIRNFRSMPQEPDAPVIIAHRYITREDTTDEDSVYLSDKEFVQRDEGNFFSMSWQANGLRYGIGTEVYQWLSSGFSVLVNGSRAYLPEAKLKFGEQLFSILVDVPEEELKRRLHSRSRESETEIEQRIARHRALSESIQCDSKLDNSGTLDSSAQKLKSIILEAMGIVYQTAH